MPPGDRNAAKSAPEPLHELFRSLGRIEGKIDTSLGNVEKHIDGSLGKIWDKIDDTNKAIHEMDNRISDKHSKDLEALELKMGTRIKDLENRVHKNWKDVLTIKTKMVAYGSVAMLVVEYLGGYFHNVINGPGGP